MLLTLTVAAPDGNLVDFEAVHMTLDEQLNELHAAQCRTSPTAVNEIHQVFEADSPPSRTLTFLIHSNAPQAKLQALCEQFRNDTLAEFPKANLIIAWAIARS